MKRTLFILFFILILTIGSYLLSPYGNYFLLINDIKNQDYPSIDQRVDWVLVQEDFKQEMKQVWDESVDQLRINNFLYNLKKAFVSKLVTTWIESMNSSQGFFELLLSQSEKKAEKSDPVQKSWYEFETKYHDLDDFSFYYPVNHEITIEIRMSRVGIFNWKVVKIKLPVREFFKI